MLFSEYNFFKLNFIEPASPLMYGIIELHDHIFFFLNMVLFVVLFLLVTTLNYFTYSSNTSRNRQILAEAANFYDFKWLRLVHGTTIEIIWTIIPSIILVLIAIPSFALLYATDELVDPSVTIQVIGHQWYWSYEYNIVTTTTNSSTQGYMEHIYNTPQAAITRAHTYPFTITNNDIRFIFASAPDLAYVVMNKGLTTLFSLKYSEFNSLQEFKSVLYPASSWIMENGLDINSFYPTKLANLITWKEVTPISTTYQFDSYMRQESDLSLGELRLYETDFPLVLPKLTHIRFLITADDVIHSWAVPALGIKVDAVPGRINQAHTFIKRSGVFYGQCSELCGVNHAFMPIQIIAFEPEMYYDYLRFLVLNK